MTTSSAHGVPQTYIKLGDMYQQHIEECVQLVCREILLSIRQREEQAAGVEKEVMQRLLKSLESSKLRFHLSYQSRVGPVEWLRPYTDDKIKELGKLGVKNLAVVPIAFVSEHIETLEEIDGEYRELAEENGVTTWRRVPALNADPL